MKRFESGYEMRIIMKPNASEKQLEIARKLYPNAVIIRGVSPDKINFKYYERFAELLENNHHTCDYIEKKINSSMGDLPRDIYKKKIEQNITKDDIMPFAA